MNPGPFFSLQVKASTSISAYLRLKVASTGLAEVAGVSASDTCIGILQNDVSASEPARNTCNIKTIDGSVQYVTVGNGTAIAIGDGLEALAGGKVGKLNAAARIGTALETASADGDIIRAIITG